MQVSARSCSICAPSRTGSCNAPPLASPRLPPDASPHTHVRSVNETLLRSTIDAIVSTGLRDAGYVYVNVDDCWASSRDLHGTVVPDPNGVRDVT